MPKVKINSQSSLSSQETFEKVSKLLDEDRELRKLDPSYTCEFDSGALCGTAKGKLFKANMAILEKSNGCEIEIVVDLPLHLALAKGLVEKALRNKISQIIG